MVMVLVLVLKEKVDQVKTENKKPQSYAKSKARSFPEFPDDPVSIESKAGRVFDDARQMKLATRKGGLLIHGGIPSKSQRGEAACVNPPKL